MRNRRKGRAPTRGGWTRESSSLAHAAKARKRMDAPPDDTPRRLPDKELLGVLQWHASDGKVRRWTIRQGPRANNVRVIAGGKAIVCGWDKLMSSLRKRLSIPKRFLA